MVSILFYVMFYPVVIVYSVDDVLSSFVVVSFGLDNIDCEDFVVCPQTVNDFIDRCNVLIENRIK